MTVIEYAVMRLNDKNLAAHEQIYWAAYLDGARAQKKEDERAEEVVHGDWIDGRPFVNSRWKVCSVCHQTAPEPHGGYNYCPNCGAKMDGSVEMNEP